MLFIDTTPGAIVLICITSLVGIFAVSASLEGWFKCHMKWYERVLSLIGGLLLIYPGLVTDITGLALVAVMVVMQFVDKNREKKTV